MPRRVSLPGAAELFRPTRPDDVPAPGSPSDQQGADPAGPDQRDGAESRGSGRVRHDEKITVYVSADELVALEQARLTLRAEHGLAVDRGRMVREAVAAALADLTERGAASTLVTRLSAR